MFYRNGGKYYEKNNVYVHVYDEYAVQELQQYAMLWYANVNLHFAKLHMQFLEALIDMASIFMSLNNLMR